MAATPEAARLTEAHRVAQANLGARVVRAILATWPLLDPADVDRTVDRWLSAAIPIITANRRTSTRLAANYLVTHRALELGVGGGFQPVLAEDVPTEQVTTSLIVTGPVTIRRAITRADPLRPAIDTARSNAARAAMRHALNGGRDTITATVAADRDALGWARATSGKACAFCAMLASRGPAYSESGVDFEAHDGCSCTAEPVYRRDAAWPAGAERYREMWDEVAAGASDPLAEFRRALSA